MTTNQYTSVLPYFSDDQYINISETILVLLKVQ